MNAFVLDASVAAKWFLPREDEELANEAFQILESFQLGKSALVVPDLFWAEIGNIFWKAARTGRVIRGVATEAVEQLHGRDFPTFPSRGLLTDAFRIATAHNRSLYDSIYVALAVRQKLDLITADLRLADALASHLPVRWLGAWSIP